MNWISLAIEGLEFAVKHKKEIAIGSETAIHVIRRIEHMCVKHQTTADNLLMAAERGLHDYNSHSGDK